MDARLQRRVQRYGWDRASAAYERYWSRQLAPAQTRLLELGDLKPGERVLDVAGQPVTKPDLRDGSAAPHRGPQRQRSRAPFERGFDFLGS